MKIKMKFVEMRAAGTPMYKISDEIGVHRTTLTMWHKELAEYIMIAKQDMMDELMYENSSMKMDRVEMITRKLMEMYSRLHSPQEKEDTDLGKILDHITKLTKLLQRETGEDSIERYFTNKKSKRMNIKTMEAIDDEEVKPFDEEAPIWITDIDSFEKYQPENDFDNLHGTNKDNAVELVPDDEFYDELDVHRVKMRDIADLDPKLQEIFKRTFRRTFKEKQELEKKAKIEESVKNSSQEEMMKS